MGVGEGVGYLLAGWEDSGTPKVSRAGKDEFWVDLGQTKHSGAG